MQDLIDTCLSKLVLLNQQFAHTAGCVNKSS